MNSNIKDIYSLTPSQKGIFAQYAQNTDTKTYQLRGLCKINKNADLDVLKKSVELLSVRHPVLKTAFTVLKSTGAIKQVVLENRNPAFVVLSQNEPYSKPVLDKLVDESTEKALDLQKDSLFRVIIIDFTDARFMIMHSHHIILDGWCLPVIVNDLQSYYSELVNGTNIEDLTDKINKTVLSETSYAQYVKWNKSQDKDSVSAYWQSLLADCSPTHIFGKEKKDTARNENIVTFETQLSNDLSQHVEQFARENKISPNSVFECAFSIALQKYSNSDDIIYDKIISGRSIPLKNIENTVGLFINTVPMRIQTNESTTLTDLLNETQNQTVNANKHGVLPLAEVYKTCNIDAKSVDALFVFENYYVGDLSTDMGKGSLSPELISFNEQTEFNLNVVVLKERNRYTVRTSYAKEVYDEKDINAFVDGYISVLDSSLDATTLIKNISVLSEEEKYALNEFNNTNADYPKDKLVLDLFEEQVEKTPDKIALVASDKTFTYKELNEEANKLANSLVEKGVVNGDIVGIKLSRTSKFMVSVLGILKSGATYLPFDVAHPQNRIEQILSDSNAKLCITEDNFDELLNNSNTKNTDIKISGDSLCYCIYTSGSTGTPKGAMIQHKNLYWYMCALTSIYGTDPINMPFFTSPSVDLSVPSYFLPLITGGTTYFYDDELLKDLTDIFNNDEINTIKVTPTHLQIILQHIEGKTLHNMKYLISGGESLYHSSCVEFLEKFGNHIEIHNEYGPTEATVSCVDYVFSCDDTDDIVSIGSPINNAQIYIVDKHLNPTPIGVTGELCIAGDGVCAGYLNNEQLTNEKFIDNPFGEGKLYKTGDLAFWKPDGNLAFVGRNDFQVKIRGLRIELGEIENAIVNIDGVTQCAVVVRKDENDRQLICAFYTGAETDARDFRTILGTKLPKYMIPHAFVRLTEMPLTSSGKISRSSLPEIDLESISTDIEYVAPETEEEKALVKAIKVVLNVEEVSVLDNFFDLGGDSLLSIELTSELENNGYTVTVKSIFDATDIQALAKELNVKEEFTEKVVYASVLPATAAQMAIYSTHIVSEEPTLYTIPLAFTVENLDADKFEKAINKLISRHEGLRTSFENRNGQIVQIINDNVSIKLEQLKSANPSDFINAFDPSKAPLLRIGYYENTVVVNFHHLIADGSTIALFYKEINELYMGRELPEAVQYGDFTVTSKYTEDDENYWLNEYNDVPVLELYTDYPKTEEQKFKGTNIFTRIDNSLNEKILVKCKELGVTPYDFYMACYNILLSKYSGNEDVCVGVPSSGRSSKYLNTWGMFVNTLSMRNQPEGTKTFKAFVTEVKKNSFEAISHQNFPQHELIKRTDSRKTLYDVLFVYQSEKMTHAVLEDKKAELLPITISISRNLLGFTILPREEDVVLMAEYRTDLFKEETINKFIEAYKSILEQCLDETKQIKDISVLSEEEKETLLNKFNSTKSDYEKDKHIHKWFEEQVEKTPDKIALVASDKTFTYKELNEEANKLANSLVEKGVVNGDIVGIKLSRTSKFMVSVLGILKSGATYLPFDVAHPQNRIEQILSDSNAKLCITEDNFDELLNNSNTKNTDIKISGDSLCYCIYTSGSTGTPKGAMIQHKNLYWYMCALTSIYGTDPINMPFFTSPSVDLSVPSYFLPLITGGTTYFYDDELLKDLTDIFNNDEINTIKVTPTHLQIILQHIEGKTLHNMKYLISGGESLYHSSCVEFLEKFGNHIEIHNEYGPTEATVSCVDYVFSCDDTDDIVSIGSPINNAQIYIVDKHLNPTPIGVTGELCIAGDGVCAGYLNNEQLTNEKFIDNPFGEGKLYKTGDLAFWKPDGNLAFVGRNDFQVKIRGLRIELGEIENAIVNIDGVTQCAVVVRKDENDRQLICAFYTGAETDARDFRTILGTKLPKYMIPHAFVRLTEMPLTSSGKISRSSLPEIDLESISTDIEYVAPETEEEKALVKAIKVVLNVEEVSLLDNFFNVGGDSISAIYLVSELEDMGYELQVSSIMQSDTLQETTSKIKAKKDIADEYNNISSVSGDYEQNEVNGFIPFTPIMRAFLKNSNGEISKDYVHTGILSVDCNEETITKALNILVSHHDMLRSTLVENGIEILPADKYKAYSFESINIDDKDAAILKLRNTTLDDKLVKAILCYTGNECLLSITVHHFFIDFVSWEILMKDFTTIVRHLHNDEEVCLPAKTASFKYWNEALEEYSEVISEENKDYWKQINESLDNSVSFIADAEENQAEEYSFTFSKEISQKLINKVNKTYKTRTNEVLLTALGLAAGKLADGNVGIMVESHGRAELHKPIATEKTVGWFTTCYPVVVNNNNNVAAEIVNVRDTVREISRNGIEYLLLNNGFHNNANIKFNYYKNNVSNENRENKLVAFNSGSFAFPDMINVSCFVADDTLSMSITVPICKHKKGISEELGKEFVKQIEKIIEAADVLPATAAQMRIYTAQAMSSEPTLYNLSSAFKMENLDISGFEAAINKLIARHEALRTSFENRNGQIFQIIHETASIKLEKLESSDLSAFNKPFDLTKAPLLRVGYIDDTVIVSMHHIISDGTTFGLFYREINKLYMGEELPEAAQYREFTVSDTYTKEDEEYWLKEFEELPDFELYTDFPKQNAKGDKGRNLFTQIDQSLHENILARCKEWGVTPYAYYMACISILLSKYSGSEDVCVGVTSNGRGSKFLDTFGMFVNMLSIRTKPESEKKFKDLVLEIKDNSFNAIAHQSYPQQELLKKLNVKKPLYDVMFIYLSGKETQAIGRDKNAESIHLTISTSRAPLMFYVHPRENDAALRIEYLTDLFKPETIDKLVASYMDILAQALNEKVLIKDLSIIAEDEKNTILNTFNNTNHEYDVPANSTLYSLFESASEENKDKVCVIANDEKMTFAEFKAFAERIDNKVRSVTNSEKSVIAVITERSFEMYGAIYGIIRGGNAYLPIDPNYPQDRIDYILSNSNAKAVVTQAQFCHLVSSVPCINATELLNNKEAIEYTPILATPDDTAYVIYTSGSTGNPKGAKISHKSAVNRILWMHETYPLVDNDVILQKTPYTFDVSVWEHFWWGITGKTLCASKPDEHFLPAKILNETEKNKVTHIHFVPSVFDLFLTYLENNPQEQSKFNSVKYVFLSGEALTANSINRFYNIYDYNKVSLHNLYGPTECAVDVSYYPCVPNDIDPVPIGKPIYNTQLHIVDKYNNIVPIGVTGELCIAGVNVGQGYLNNEQLTNEKFIPNPFGNGKLYKTGDLAYWREDGQICYVGRMDNQIKLNGQRIELGEIEKVISEISDVESVAVMIKQNNGQDVLVAFCCGNESSTNEILKHCENKLPHYMIPNKLVFVEKMPLNPSGKLDRKVLNNIEVAFDSNIIKEEPVNGTEKMVCGLFRDILAVESVGRNENFFALGGTSLDMIAILSENELKNISAADFIANPTPEKLAKLLDLGNIPDSDGFYTLRSAPSSTKALILFPYAGGDASAFAALTKDLSVIAPDLSLYYVDYLHSYAECEKVAEKIAVLAKSKEINIYSHCAGTAVAMQIINILEKQNIVISNYITAGFIPSENPGKRNGWNYKFKRSIQQKLIKAGAPIDKLSVESKYSMVEKFRKDTDFMTEYFYKNAKTIKTKTSVIISKTDIFTKNYMDAERLWKIRSSNFDRVHYIDSDSHYFQTEKSDEVAQIIIDTISE